MANDSIDINITGVGKQTQSANLNLSELQTSIDKISQEFKKLETSNFQKSLKDLTQGIQKAAISASNFVSNMQKIEARLTTSLKEGLYSGNIKTENVSKERVESKEKDKKSGDNLGSEKFVKSIDSLTSSIEKLARGIKEDLKGTKEEKEEKPKETKSDLINDAKKLLAAVGLSSLAKQFTENEIITPARATGMLINSNVIANPRQAGSELLSSFENRVANNTSTIAGSVGAGLGGLIGSFIPGAGTLVGAGIGYAAGSSFGNNVGQTKLATELPTLQRSLLTDYYSNLSKQTPQFKSFAETQYGPKGFTATEAFQDPYFESKAEFGRSFARFAGGNLNRGTTQNILESLTAQGSTSPQDLNQIGNLLGQIARFTGKSSLDTEKVYKAVEKTGVAPIEGLQKTLSLLQSGLSVKETENLIKNTSQRTEAFTESQTNYFKATPFQQYSAQLAGKVTGVDTEKFFEGDAEEIAKARKIFQEAASARKRGVLTNSSILAEVLETRQGIFPSAADNNLKAAQGVVNQEFIKPSEAQQKIIDTTQQAIIKGAKGRGPETIVDEALKEIGKSTEKFSGLSEAAKNLTESFEDAAKSFASFVQKTAPLNFFGYTRKPIITQAGGR